MSFREFLQLCFQDIYTHALVFLSKMGLYEPIRSLVHRTHISKWWGDKEVSLPFACQADLSALSAKHSAELNKPIIFVSACENETNPGDVVFSGGMKELNLLVKLLRKKGFEAYVVTYDGTFRPWLIEHQPHISLEEFRHKIKYHPNVRCVTSWAIAQSFIKESPNIYFWDMELSLTDHKHFPIMARLYREKIKSVAAISRTIQAWHMAHFKIPVVVIPNLLDESIWFPIDECRHKHAVGYMNEGLHTENYLNIINKSLENSNIRIDFLPIKGDESEVLEKMRSCEIFLSLNIGKDPLWGEGCPRTIIEALSAGCVVIAFDIVGNKEIIHNGFNSLIVPRYRADLMAKSLIKLYNKSEEIDHMRENSLSLIKTCHTLNSRWPLVAEFLKLDDYSEGK